MPRLRKGWRSLSPYLISFLCHALLIGAVVIFERAEPGSPPAEESLSVDLVTEEEFARLAAPAKRPERAPQIPGDGATPPKAPPDLFSALPPATPEAPAIPPAIPAPAETEPRWHRAGRLLSQAALLDPHNKKILDTLPLLELSTRLEQLCDMEAALQIRQIGDQYRPEFVVAYAMLATRTVDHLLIADGAAFLSQGQWYRLAFKCRISPRGQKVEAFEFAIGAAIPKRDWAAHNLPAKLTGSKEE